MYGKLIQSADIFNIQGVVLPDEPLWRHCTFGVGGPADWFAVPENTDDLRVLLTDAARHGISVSVLGEGSNVLISDLGIRGVVIDTRNLNEYRMVPENAAPPAGTARVENTDHPNGAPGRTPPREVHQQAPSTPPHTQRILTLGAGLPISQASWKSGSAGWAGLEHFFSMPGTVGGAILMNARCYDREMADVLEWVEVMHPNGVLERVPMNPAEWSYKNSPFQGQSGVIVRAAVRLQPASAQELREQMHRFREERLEKGHFRARCAGSAFKNDRRIGIPSGQLIDRCGLKGMQLGDAAVSEWHGNIVINRGKARAQDVRQLLEKVAHTVQQQTGFRLEPEIQMLGQWEKVTDPNSQSPVTPEKKSVASKPGVGASALSTAASAPGGSR